MAWYTQKEFAEKCGISPANLSVNKKRGKVIVSKKGLIDDYVAENREFLQKCQERISEKDKETEAKPQKNEQKNKKNAVSESKKPFVEPVSSPISQRGMLDIQKKENEIEKLQVETRLAKLREEKIRGEVIPLLLVKHVFHGHSQSIIMSMKEGCESLLITISKEARLTGDQLAKLRGEMTRMLNEAMEKAVNGSERSLKKVEEEFSTKREVGEHN